MALALVVAVPFDNYKIGDQITDQATVDAVRASENARHVRAVDLDSQADPAPGA
jgi:hypothetical protein